MQKRNITVKNRSGKVIYNGNTLVPRTVFVISPDPTTGKIDPKSMFVFAVKGEEPLTQSTEFYSLPMYNIFERNQICWGSYVNYDFGTADDLSKCASVHARMYEATCNLDLTPRVNWNWIHENIPGPHNNIESFVHVFKYLEDKEEYPEELLIPTRFGF